MKSWGVGGASSRDVASHVLLFSFVTFRARFWPHLGQVPGSFRYPWTNSSPFPVQGSSSFFRFVQRRWLSLPCSVPRIPLTSDRRGPRGSWLSGFVDHLLTCPTPLLLGTEAGNKMYCLAGQVTSLLVSCQVTQIIFMAVDTWRSQREF